MTVALIIQQQQLRCRQKPPAPAQGGPWQFWDAGTLADILGCPQANVRKSWPLIHAALAEQGIDDQLVQMAALATTAIETASQFAPVREAFWMSEEWRRANLRYYPYYGRGFIQLTWNGPTIFNYQYFGEKLGVDLVGNPDLALDPDIGAKVLALFFLERGVADAARARNWAGVRSRVQGGSAGLQRLIDIVNALDRVALPESDSTGIEPAITAGLSRIGDPYVWDGERPGAFDCSGFVTWMFRQIGVELPSYTDDAYDATRPVSEPQRGDLIFYRYVDPNQPRVTWPHMGMWLGDGTTLESRWPDGVNVYRPLSHPYELRRVPR